MVINKRAILTHGYYLSMNFHINIYKNTRYATSSRTIWLTPWNRVLL